MCCFASVEALPAGSVASCLHVRLRTDPVAGQILMRRGLHVELCFRGVGSELGELSERPRSKSGPDFVHLGA